jgi:hypothetical protein
MRIEPQMTQVVADEEEDDILLMANIKLFSSSAAICLICG